MAEGKLFSIFKGKAMPTPSPVPLTGAIADDARLHGNRQRHWLFITV
jgi:hypothetical protein